MSRINFLNLVDSYNPTFEAPLMAESQVKLLFVKEAVSRSERRGQERAYFKLLSPLIDVEETFCGSIFNEELDMSYEEIYTHCLNEFRGRVKRLNETKKINHIVINEHYFEQLYSKKWFKDLDVEVS